MVGLVFFIFYSQFLSQIPTTFCNFATYCVIIINIIYIKNMELASKYNPADVEGKWYQYWLDNKLFSSKPDGREPYTIVDNS